MTSLVYVVLCIALVVGNKRAGNKRARNKLKSLKQELRVKRQEVEDLKYLFYTSMSSIISLNELVTDLSEKIAKLIISSAETEISKALLSQEIKNVDSKIMVVVAAITPIYSLRATCDNVMTVFVDGVEQKAEGLDNWRQESQIPVPSNFKVIGIQCVDHGVIPGILASLHDENGDKVLVTDESWTCSQEGNEGWAEPGFDSGAWEGGDIIGKNGVAPWKFIRDISRDASWIWTEGHQTHTTVYCRYVSTVTGP